MYRAVPLFPQYEEKRRTSHDKHHFWTAKGGPKIESFTCTCAVGKGLCQHTTGLLYSMSHFQLLGLKSIPPIISKTSLPQVCSDIENAIFPQKFVSKLCQICTYIFTPSFFMSRHGIFQRGWMEFSHGLSLKLS